MHGASNSKNRKCGKILCLNDNSKIAATDENLFDTCIGIISVLFTRHVRIITDLGFACLYTNINVPFHSYV